jgi:choline monooxygenase
VHPLREIVDRYDPDLPLERASTIPAAWYLDPRILDLERRTVFTQSWHFAARAAQLGHPGQYVTTDIAGEPVALVCGTDGVTRALFNVCRHHAAAVLTEAEGSAEHLRCPYHGWTYALDGQLKGTPDFSGACDFDRAASGLVPIASKMLASWMFVRLSEHGTELREFLGDDLIDRLERLSPGCLSWMERRSYVLDCNWKVFVDNYLDGGYHVPHLHKGLHSRLDYSQYTIENGRRHCLQSSPHDTSGRALYYWIYPNFMINWYGDQMDTNLVVPLAVDRTAVVFDFYFADASHARRADNLASIAASEQIQDEDVAICTSVQRGLQSRAYGTGRLSPRREAGEHLFHRLLHRDLQAGLASGDAHRGDSAP